MTLTPLFEVGEDLKAGHVLRAMQAHVVAEASVHGTLLLNASVLG